MLDFSPVHSRVKTSQELAAGLSREDLAKLTDEMCDLQLEAIRDAVDEDVDRVPEDPEANDTFAAKPEDVGLSWTLGHVVVHTTASSEEAAAVALTLARGLPVDGRSRYEVPWEGVRTAAFIRGRIEESRRMRLAMLAAWPDKPHLDNFYAPSESLSPNAWKSVIEIDLYGTFFTSQAVLPVMRTQGGGSIVNISMTLHYRGWPLMAHATAAKAGIDALTRTLALEWAKDGVRMNAIAPGPIPTEGVRKAFTPPSTAEGVPDVFAVERAMESYAKKAIPLQRWGTPADIGNMVAFLASPAGSWITGAIMVVDGGEWLAKPPPPR